MREFLTTVHVENEEECQNFDLDYYILAKSVRVEEKQVLRYGVEIYKRARRKDGRPYAEYRKIFDVFATEAEAREFLRLLARNAVTPISMKDVVEDVLGITEFAGEFELQTLAV